jgi:subtilisin family serine protease
MWYQGFGLRACRGPLATGRGLRIGTRILGPALILLLSASLTYGVGTVEAPTPPSPPDVAPIISEAYPADLNANRIDDALESGAPGQGELSIASADERVSVELIFREPITQGQIDVFLRLGGRITYIYRAISYGWNGDLPRTAIGLLPTVMGPALVQVESVERLVPYMDVATQTGRVRPIWKAGFAGSSAGFSGDANTTIAFVGGGVDAEHADLQGRCVYWRDFSADADATPVDFDGHQTLVAGVAVGTGKAAGADAGPLKYTYAADWPDYFHMADPIGFSGSSITMRSEATWTGGTATLLHNIWKKGTSGEEMAIVGNRFSEGQSPQTVTNTFSPSGMDVVGVVLADFDENDLDNVVIITSVSPYPGVGDSFNKLSGVAPGCKWAAAKVFDRDGSSEADRFTAAIDDLVARRIDKKIKVLNISYGLGDWLGFPKESASLRDKVNSVVKNGIIVVAAAGNNAAGPVESYRKMADPARAAQAITVGAVNDQNVMTGYSTYGFFSPRTNSGEDFKPDVVAPGGSLYYTGIMSVDSGSSDGVNEDKEPDDYANYKGTSFAAPFVAGSAALVIQAMERQGAKWAFNSPAQPRYVKMLLCATAGETNARREGADKNLNPTLERAAGGPNAFPPGKDQHEGYGLLNPDAAVEAVCQTYGAGATVTADLGPDATAKRVWARTMQLKAKCDVDIALENPAGGDFDLYLYSAVPSDTGTPVLLQSSTTPNKGASESIRYTPTADTTALLVVKRASGAGSFTLRSTQAGPPTALNIQAAGGMNSPVTITLKATDDGRPDPPGAISYTIVSKPAKGRLELADGTPIASVPAKLPGSGNKVVYRPPANWVGEDKFTFSASDGGVAPFGGSSNTATVTISVSKEITLECRILDSADDVAADAAWATEQAVTNRYLLVGAHAAGLRFRNVKIPQGALIKRATLKVQCFATYWNTAAVDGVLKGEAADNPPAFDATTRIVTELPTTQASTAWPWTQDAPWTKGTWYESPDIGPIIQEIVRRPDWTSDNALVLVYGVRSRSSSDRAFWSYDGDPAAAPILTITYQP